MAADCRFRSFRSAMLHLLARGFAPVTQPGIKSLELVSMMPYADVIASSLQATKAARLATGYAGPGPAAPSGPGVTAP